MARHVFLADGTTVRSKDGATVVLGENGNVRIDPTGSVYVKIRDGKSAETQELVYGMVFADYDCDGKLLGIEVVRGG